MGVGNYMQKAELFFLNSLSQSLQRSVSYQASLALLKLNTLLSSKNRVLPIEFNLLAFNLDKSACDFDLSHVAGWVAAGGVGYSLKERIYILFTISFHC